MKNSLLDGSKVLLPFFFRILLSTYFISFLLYVSYSFISIAFHLTKKNCFIFRFVYYFGGTNILNGERMKAIGTLVPTRCKRERESNKKLNGIKNFSLHTFFSVWLYWFFNHFLLSLLIFSWLCAFFRFSSFFFIRIVYMCVSLWGSQSKLERVE